MKRWKTRLAAAVLMLCTVTGLLSVGPRGLAAGQVSVQVDGVELPRSQAMLWEDTTYVSLRAFAQAMGASRIAWENGRALVEDNGWQLSARPGEQYLTVNGRAFYIPGGVQLREGVTMVPVRAMAEAYGAQVAWQPGKVTVTKGSGSAVPGGSFYDGDVLYWLSRIISAESKGEPLAGQIAVGNVVLNRVASSQFPNSVYGVIFDSANGVQFTPVAIGTIYEVPTEQSVIAAKLVLEGADTAGGSLYFFAPALSQGTWIRENRIYSHTIGNHRFYL